MVRKRRIYEVAKELDIETIEVMKTLKLWGVRADNIFNAIDDDLIQRLKDNKDKKEETKPVMSVDNVEEKDTVVEAAKIISQKYGVDEEEVLDSNNVEKIEHKPSAPKYKVGEYKGSHNNHKPKFNPPPKNNNDPNKVQSQLKEVISRLDSAIRGLRCLEADISEVNRNVNALNDKMNDMEYMLKKLLPDSVILDPEWDRQCREARAKALEDHCNNIIKQNRNNGNNGNYNP